MNDRIFGLAHQAGFNTLWNGAHIVFDVSTKENMKEFAELVVRECANIGFNTDYPNKGVEVLRAIKKHFGVK